MGKLRQFWQSCLTMFRVFIFLFITTIFTLKIGTPKFLTMFVLNVEIHFTNWRDVWKSAASLENVVDPNQTPHSAASDLGLHYLQSQYLGLLW